MVSDKTKKDVFLEQKVCLCLNSFVDVVRHLK